ncbi:MAG: sugar phosphate isomerase/epimerase family protein [Clostridiaceae bacterium]|nr:sugar phosphate isomerase/epimerase family protein [Clostridiaceae bacterium]
MKISVMSSGFRLGFEDGVRKAREIGAAGIQMYAGETGLDFTHEPLPCIARGIRTFVDNVGLTVSAVCVDIGGFACEESLLSDRLLRTRNMLKLAARMDVHTVTSHIGKVPADKVEPVYAQLVTALREVGGYCAELGVAYAIETGPEKAVVLKSFLEDVAVPSIGVNLDPANLVMCSDDDPVAATHTLGKYIRHTHAKDGICLMRAVHKPWPDVPEGRPWIEVPLGCGEVDFPAWIRALRAEGYDGFLAIEREAGDDPAKDIKTALDFLKTQI